MPVRDNARRGERKREQEAYGGRARGGASEGQKGRGDKNEVLARTKHVKRLHFQSAGYFSSYLEARRNAVLRSQNADVVHLM